MTTANMFVLLKPVLILVACLVGFFLVVCAVALLKGIKLEPKQWNLDSTIKARTPLTPHEQKMFFRLSETFPGNVVLSQVAFSALITTPINQRSVRNTFDRKVADFVLCDTAFKVIAVIELDDRSHRNRAREDAARAALLENAGYVVLRYMGVPSSEELMGDFQMAP